MTLPSPSDYWKRSIFVQQGPEFEVELVKCCPRSDECLGMLHRSRLMRFGGMKFFSNDELKRMPLDKVGHCSRGEDDVSYARGSLIYDLDVLMYLIKRFRVVYEDTHEYAEVYTRLMDEKMREFDVKESTLLMYCARFWDVMELVRLVRGYMNKGVPSSVMKEEEQTERDELDMDLWLGGCRLKCGGECLPKGHKKKQFGQYPIMKVKREVGKVEVKKRKRKSEVEKLGCRDIFLLGKQGPKNDRRVGDCKERPIVIYEEVNSQSEEEEEEEKVRILDDDSCEETECEMDMKESEAPRTPRLSELYMSKLRALTSGHGLAEYEGFPEEERLHVASKRTIEYNMKRRVRQLRDELSQIRGKREDSAIDEHHRIYADMYARKLKQLINVAAHRDF
jgi:hypothetical protein